MYSSHLDYIIVTSIYLAYIILCLPLFCIIRMQCLLQLYSDTNLPNFSETTIIGNLDRCTVVDYDAVQHIIIILIPNTYRIEPPIIIIEVAPSDLNNIP